MKFAKWFSVVALLACFGFSRALAEDSSYVSAEDVTWTALGQNENDSMPIGNGDLAANVWTEPNGDLVVLVAKSDAWTGMGKLVKLGRVRIQLTPNPWVGAEHFQQILRLENGEIEIRNDKDVVRVWIDANHPVLHVEAELKSPAILQAKLELWRTQTHSYNELSPDRGGLFEFGDHPVPLEFETDTIAPADEHSILWYHYNRSSIFPLVFKQEHLDSVLSQYTDPLLHRCFGATIAGLGLARVDDHTLRSVTPSSNPRVDLIALTETQVADPATFQSNLKELAVRMNRIPLASARSAHQQWWRQFWNRSWIRVTGSDDAAKVSQGYVMQRYMVAASSRGAFPTKFNGGLFTVGHDIAESRDSTNRDHNPDFRAWGNSYWNQNTRLLYWPLVATGDFDLLQPWFRLYVNALPLAEDRARVYFHHGGALFAETMYFWGLPNLNDFGWDNPTTEMQSEWQRYHIQGSLEVIAEMLDAYDVTQDQNFARHEILPLANAVVTFYAQHWPRGADGKIYISPSQSLETYQVDAANPTPDIAGLRADITRLLALPSGIASAEQRASWKETLDVSPSIPTGTTAKDKTPPQGKGDSDGTPVILPAAAYGSTKNTENPELYVAFPYRLYGVGKPDLKLAQDSFVARKFPQDTCWGQDGPQAAVLGLTAVAQRAAIDEFTDYGDQHFQWFWKAGHDWIPDLDNGGTGMMTLELMVMQTDGRRIQLLPAWPKDWTADFKLHAPYHTVVEGHVENGKITHLQVTPPERARDVVVDAAKHM